MKTRNLIHLLLSVCFLCACTNEDDIAKYGDKQVLEGSEWIYTIQMDGLAPNISLPTETLRFGTQELTMIFTNWKYDDKTQQVQEVTSAKLGSYEYKHPKLKLFFEDGTEIEAWISTNNKICFYNEKGGFREFSK